jgi:hypothetical protein
LYGRGQQGSSVEDLRVWFVRFESGAPAAIRTRDL